MAEFRIQQKSLEKPESIYLREYAENITSQTGEDGIREKIFEIIGAENKWCVEFGAWDGKHFSNSWSLLNKHDWKGVLIEGDANKFSELSKNYESNDDVILCNSYVDYDDSDNSLDSILKQTPIPTDFDFITIDVDGLDWFIWESLSHYRPRLVIIEFNPTIPNDIFFVQDRDKSINHGSSLRAMIELGKKKGYELVVTTQWNAFFVPKELFALFKIEDNDIDAMHTIGTFESKLFQLYDGTMVLLGNSQLIWKGIPINQSDIQVLPVAMRKYQG